MYYPRGSLLAKNSNGSHQYSQPYASRFPIHRNYRVIGDERIGHWEIPERESTAPESTILYSGTITLADISGTEYQRESIRFVLSFHLRNLSLYIIPFVVTYGLGPRLVAWSWTGFLALRYHGIPLIVQIWRVLHLSNYSEFALMKCRGWGE